MTRRRRAWIGRPVVALAAAALVVALAAPGSAARAPDQSAVRVIVVADRAAGGSATGAAAVAAAGGRVVHGLGSMAAVVADVPVAGIAAVRAAPGIRSVTADARLELQQTDPPPAPDGRAGSLRLAAAAIGAPAYWQAGYTGHGVDVALIDSGVAPVEGLTAPGAVVNGPDLSFESQDDDTRYVDTFGHGTHLAGIIAGRDTGVDPAGGAVSPDTPGFLGVAPGARVVSLKVADARGNTDVSQVIAAIDWVVQHRRSGDLDIRVLSLSFGTDGTQDRRLDPLSYAVEVAWRHGLVVVVAVGNDGRRSGPLRNPAMNPFPIAVGATDTRGTAPVGDDVVPAFSNRGNGERQPDLVAPGTSLASLRAPGSTVDEAHPHAMVDGRLLLGTGTSQATAMVAGAVALVLEQRPHLTPDQVKTLLRVTARKLAGHSPKGQGAGVVALDRVLHQATPAGAAQWWERGTGTGTLDGARGSHRLVRDGVVLRGEQDIFGTPFDAPAWARASAAGSSWSAGVWNGSTWSGSSWSGSSWSGSTWSGSSWSGSSWSGSSWTGSTWSGSSWSSSWG